MTDLVEEYAVPGRSGILSEHGMFQVPPGGEVHLFSGRLQGGYSEILVRRAAYGHRVRPAEPSDW